jgi:(heptosyl)LPS beta-1,4-glucosyltransferase
LGVFAATDLKSGLRRLVQVAAVLAATAALLSYSRSAVAAIALTLVLAGLLVGRKVALRVILLLAITGIVVWIAMPGLAGRYAETSDRDLDRNYEGGRIFIWLNSWDIIRNHPLLGVGTGNFETEYAARLRPDIESFRKHAHAHNDLINIAASNGIPGACLFAGLWVVVLRLFWRQWRRLDSGVPRYYALAALLASIAFFLTSLTEATFADEEVRQLLMFTWAAGLWPLYNGRAVAGGPETS